MFERVVLRRSIDGPPITAGELAEAMLFYQNVHIVLDHGSLAALDSSIGIPRLLALTSRPGISATYIEELTGTSTRQSPRGPEHSLVVLKLAGDKSVGQLKSRKKRLEFLFERFGYSKAQARRLAQRFRNQIRIKTLTDDYFVKGGLIPTARLELSDSTFLQAAAGIVVQDLLRRDSLPEDFFFRIRFRDDSFSVLTNADFAEINSTRQALDPNAGEYSSANVTSIILSAVEGTILAGHYGGDFLTSTVESRIIQLRQHALLRRTTIDQDQIKTFSSIAIDGYPRIREVIDSGQRSFVEFLEVFEAASRFRTWLKSKSPDENLVSAYLEDVTSASWLNRIPTKSARYIVGSAVGAIEPLAGLTLSAVDSFLLEKFLGGWRPNLFVNRELRQFLAPNADD